MPAQLSPQERRLQLLKHIYDKSGADTMTFVDLHKVAAEIGMDVQAAEAAVQYLADKGLVRWHTPEDVTITADEIGVIEGALEAPDRQTALFPPARNVIQIENVYQSQINQASPGSVQNLTVGDADRAAIERLLGELGRNLARLQLTSERVSDLKADIETIQAQLRSSRPKASIVRECLISARTVPENATGAALAQGYIQQINAILGT